MTEHEIEIYRPARSHLFLPHREWVKSVIVITEREPEQVCDKLQDLYIRHVQKRRKAVAWPANGNWAQGEWYWKEADKGEKHF